MLTVKQPCTDSSAPGAVHTTTQPEPCLLLLLCPHTHTGSNTACAAAGGRACQVVCGRIMHVYTHAPKFTMLIPIKE